MSSSEDIVRQLTLQKNQAKRNGAQSSNRLGQIDEEMAYWKNRAKTQDQKIAVDKLLSLRAEQTILHIKNLHEESPVIAKHKTDSIIAAYYADCTRLLAALQT